MRLFNTHKFSLYSLASHITPQISMPLESSGTYHQFGLLLSFHTRHVSSQYISNAILTRPDFALRRNSRVYLIYGFFSYAESSLTDILKFNLIFFLLIYLRPFLCFFWLEKVRNVLNEHWELKSWMKFFNCECCWQLFLTLYKKSFSFWNCYGFRAINWK